MQPLEVVLRYENQRVVRYFASKYGLPESDAEELFIDLKKWLWLCAQRSADAAPVKLFREFAAIDEFWHTFLLFTKDYIAFCTTYFGFLVLHDPQPNILGLQEANQLKANPGPVRERNLRMLRQSMAEVARVLGPDTLDRRYRDIPERYGTVFSRASV